MNRNLSRTSASHFFLSLGRRFQHSCFSAMVSESTNRDDVPPKVLPASCRQILHFPRAVPCQKAFAPSESQIVLLFSLIFRQDGPMPDWQRSTLSPALPWPLPLN